jgi:hypothetical protein
MDDRKQRTANIVLAIGGANGFVSTEVRNSTFVLRISVSAKNPAHRQYAARWQKLYWDNALDSIKILPESGIDSFK